MMNAVMEKIPHKMVEMSGAMDREQALEIFLSACKKRDTLFITDAWIEPRLKKLRKLLPRRITAEQASSLRRVLMKDFRLDDMIDCLENEMSLREPRIVEPKLARFKVLQNGWIGSRVIFSKHALLSPARIDHIKADNQGVTFHLTLIPTRGFTVKQERQVRVEGGWDHFSFDEHFCHATYVNWAVFFGDDLVSNIEKYAAGLADDLDDKERLRRILRRVFKYMIPSWRPGEDD